MYTKSAVAISALALSGMASAQSTVTLYGVIDTGVIYVNHQSGRDNFVGMKQGTMSGNRWGVRGEEDLGSGLKAVFVLENGFNSANGALNQGGREFGRQAFVGLSSDRFGTIRLGRQYDPVVDTVQGLTADAYIASTAGTPGDVDNYDNSLRVSNAVKYLSPVYAGLQFEALYAFGNNAGATGQGQAWGGAVSYKSGPLAAAAGYFHTNNPSAGRTTTKASNWGVTSSSDSIFDGPINNGYTTAHSIAIFRAAAQYTAGPFVLGASYSNAQYKHDAFSAFQSNETYNVGSGYVTYWVNPAWRLSAGYTYMRASGDTSAIYHQVGLGTDYALSKRTDVYLIGSYQHASGTQATYNSAGQRVLQPAQASIGSFGYAGTSTQELVQIGLRHRF
ncbi:porin [Burkholderia sp. Bp9142]|uniref:porin n=1 Tax=Burkholderia sp. Bp9142 TaxID=2184573 RepID=UPI000F5A58F7|nr:porin [Burkholderia sp. Bp9142]RQR24091.1 porin [Burkholderia sp. Bp9142]